MSTDTPSSVSMRTSEEPIASVPAWRGEVALLAHPLTRLGLLAALDATSVEALRSVLLQDALARLGSEAHVGGLWHRQGNPCIVFDLDGTRQAARPRALPQGPDVPPPQRRLSAGCPPGSRGRKRGEVVRTRTTLWAAPRRIGGSSPLEARALESSEASWYGDSA